MYSREIYRDRSDEVISIPQNYSGSTFQKEESPPKDNGVQENAAEQRGNAADTEQASAEPKGAGMLGGLGRLLEGGRVFKGGFLNGLSDTVKHIGTEEILLIALALFLFLSKDGDKECALMLVLLVFIA